MRKMGMPNRGQFPLDVFVIGESTPAFMGEHGLLAAQFFVLSFEKTWF
jgi:hypothetical protein